MIRELHQKEGKNYRKFAINEENLEVEFLYEGNYTKYQIDFEEIDFKEVISSRSASKIEIALLFSFLLNILLLLFILITNIESISFSRNAIGSIAMGVFVVVGIWGAKLLKKENIKTLMGTQNISFIYKENDKKKVDDFINALKAAKKDNFRKRYVKIDEHIPTETQKANLLWLYQGEQIDKKEYEALLEELEKIRIIKGE